MLTKTGFTADRTGSPPLGADRGAPLLRWRTENDHDGIDEGSLRQAAALATVVTDGGRPSFGDTFRDFAEFVAHMPF